MKTQAQKRAQARRAAMRGWQEGKWLGGKRYPRDHPWNGDQKPTAPAKPCKPPHKSNPSPTRERGNITMQIQEKTNVQSADVQD